ncbi:hypothetical protein NC653_040811 [Populus alba x Populus x berolinensis]|uniref:Uncharacterized protein n=1 Tax=Populus alba x Populus x berolinensis TaxID=444605 RepID=A0AAD6PN87_9ROSI|nr:hypothetical protein NC653_040811 [Populus alba x Populus x berolinensis]
MMVNALLQLLKLSFRLLHFQASFFQSFNNGVGPHVNSDSN